MFNTVKKLVSFLCWTYTALVVFDLAVDALDSRR